MALASNAATGAEVPLLPKHASGHRKPASVLGAVFNVSTSIIGAGIMSIPATLKVLGVVPAFVMIVFIGLLVDVSVEFVLRFTYCGESRTYAGLMRESFGRPGSVAVQICVMITNLGGLVMYLIIIGCACADCLSGLQKKLTYYTKKGWFVIHFSCQKSIFEKHTLLKSCTHCHSGICKKTLMCRLNMMMAVVDCLVLGDVLSGTDPAHLGLLQEWFGVHWWNSRPIAILLIVVFVMLPLVLFRRVESLSLSSAVSVFLAVVFVGICSCIAIVALIRGETKSPRILPDLENGVSVFDLFTAIPVITTAFTFHFNVHAIGVEMSRPAGMIVAVRISLVLCGAIYFAIGLFGYLLFGDSTNDDILVNFDRSSGSSISPTVNDIVRLSYALHLILVFPLLNFPLRANIAEFLFSKKPLVAVDARRFVLLTLALLVVAYVLAIGIPSIWYLFQFNGTTSAIGLAFIFPGAVALRDVHGISTAKDKMIATTMIGLAVITSTIAISINIYKMVEK